MELGCCGCRALASEVMIYCFVSFDNWQMETTRCRAREGGKFLSIRTPLTFTRKQRSLILCCLLQKSCAGFGGLSRGCGDTWRGSLPSSGCLSHPPVSWSDLSCMERLSWRMGSLLCHAGNSSVPFEKSHRTEQCRGNSS